MKRITVAQGAKQVAKRTTEFEQAVNLRGFASPETQRAEARVVRALDAALGALKRTDFHSPRKAVIALDPAVESFQAAELRLAALSDRVEQEPMANQGPEAKFVDTLLERTAVLGWEIRSERDNAERDVVVGHRHITPPDES